LNELQLSNNTIMAFDLLQTTWTDCYTNEP